MLGGAEDFCRGCADFTAGGEAGFSGGTVGVAGVDGNDANLSAAVSEVLRAYRKRRCFDSVGREERAGAGGLVGDSDGEVGLAAGLDSGFDGGEAEAAREGIILNGEQRILRHGLLLGYLQCR